MPTSFDDDETESTVGLGESKSGNTDKTKTNKSQEKQIEENTLKLEGYFAKKIPPKHVKTTIHHLWSDRFRVNQYVKKENGDVAVGRSYFCRVLAATNDVWTNPPVSG